MTVTPTETSWRDRVMRKCGESVEVKEKFLDRHADRIGELCQLMARRFEARHRLLVMGNGGSACDAQHVALEFNHPIIEKRRPLPTIDLVGGTPLVTAISNDEDFARVFVDQIKLWGQPGDMALALSSSGQSPNLIYALTAAKEMGLLTIAFSGKDGGRLAEIADYAFIVPSYSIHRIQEAHVALLHIVWDLTHVALGEEDVL
jgi:D-sedoheptulose 7-phosphate isomerase